MARNGPGFETAGYDSFAEAADVSENDSRLLLAPGVLGSGLRNQSLEGLSGPKDLGSLTLRARDLGGVTPCQQLRAEVKLMSSYRGVAAILNFTRSTGE